MMNATNEAPKIIRVIDTRDFELIGERRVPVQGSGEPRPCDRCGRDHEVHAHVRYADGTEATVGTGCMGLGKEEARKVAAKATLIAKKIAELRDLRAELAAYAEIKAQVDAMVAPEVTIGTRDYLPGRKCAFCGDTWQLIDDRSNPEPAAREFVAREWRSEQMNDVCKSRNVRRSYYITADIEHAEKYLRKAGAL